MSLLVFDVHGLVEYGRNGKRYDFITEWLYGREKQHYLPSLLTHLKIKLGENAPRILFWTKGDQDEANKLLRKAGVNGWLKKQSFGIDNRLESLELMNPYPCIGKDFMPELSYMINRGDMDYVTKALKVLGISKDVNLFIEEFREWRNTDLYSSGIKNPAILANKTDEQVILVESDGGYRGKYGGIYQSGDTQKAERSADEFGTKLILVPEWGLAKELGTSQGTVFKQLESELMQALSPGGSNGKEGRYNGRVIDIGRDIGVYPKRQNIDEWSRVENDPPSIERERLR